MTTSGVAKGYHTGANAKSGLDQGRVEKLNPSKVQISQATTAMPAGSRDTASPLRRLRVLTLLDRRDPNWGQNLNSTAANN